MNEFFTPEWPANLSETMRIGMALVVAGLAGEAVARFVRLPRVSGYALAGLLLGPAALGWFAAVDLAEFRIFIDLALALLLFELGSRVDLHWFRTNPWIIPTSVLEAALTFGATFAVLRVLGYSPGMAETVAAIAVGTSPAVVMRVATELRANGQVTQRLFVLTALNVLYSVVLSKLVLGGMHGAFRHDWTAAVLHPIYLLGGSLVVGILLSCAFSLVRRCFELSDEQAVAILLGLMLLTLSLLKIFALPSMLAPLLAGVLVKNADRRPLLWPQHFGTAGGVLVIFLFVLTGAMLTVQDLTVGGLVALAVVAARLVGKSVGVAALGPVSGLSMRQSLALGLALMPMSAVAFVLVDDIRVLYPEFGTQVSLIVLSMVAVLQLIGPIAVQWALRLCKETNEKGQ